MLDFSMEFSTLTSRMRVTGAIPRTTKNVDMAGSGDIKLRVLDFGFAVFNMFLVVFN